MHERKHRIMAKQKKETAPEPEGTTKVRDLAYLQGKVTPVHEGHSAYIKEQFGVDVPPEFIFATYSTRVPYRKTSEQYQGAKSARAEAKEAATAAKEEAKAKKAKEREEAKAKKEAEKAAAKAAEEKAAKSKAKGKQSSAEALAEADKAAAPKAGAKKATTKKKPF